MSRETIKLDLYSIYTLYEPLDLLNPWLYIWRLNKKNNESYVEKDSRKCILFLCFTFLWYFFFINLSSVITFIQKDVLNQSSRHVTSTSSVRYLCVIVASFQVIRVPEPNISAPAWAIITPLSMQNRSSVANNLASLSLHMIPIISCNRSLHPTPPTMRT